MRTFRERFLKILQAALVTLLIVATTDMGWSQGYVTSYEVIDAESIRHYRLNVVVSDSLLEYYQAKNHQFFSEGDFAKFVTPNALKPISDSLIQVYAEDEDFVNGVLAILHQIPYEVTAPAKYPVETMVDDKGDCDLFSFIAASIIRARGLDVVLFHYENEVHMNIGVSLPRTPNDARSSPYSIAYQGTEYYVAECTGDNWQDGWRLGECPEELKNAAPQIISLENCEQTSTGQVTASYQTLEAASLSLELSNSFMLQGSVLAVSGQILPAQEKANVTLYVRTNSPQWQVLDTVSTDTNGKFTYSWLTDTAGILYVRASWSGNEIYAATDSSTRIITSLPIFLVALVGATVAFAAIWIVVRLLGGRNNQTVPEPQPPEIPQ